MYSYNKKGKDYLKGFWKNRILYLFIIYFLVSLVYSVYHLLVGDFKFSVTIAENSWYIPIQIILYIFFWISFKIFGEKSKLAAIGLVFILQVALMLCLIFMNYENFWFISNYGFVFGIIFAQNKEKFDLILKKYYFVFLPVFITAFVLFSFMPKFINMYSFFRMLSTVAFCLIIALLLYQIKIVGKFWSFIGGISLEIYLLHGLIYLVLRRFISNNILWTVLTVAISIPLSYFASVINIKIKSKIKS